MGVRGRTLFLVSMAGPKIPEGPVIDSFEGQGILLSKKGKAFLVREELCRWLGVGV